MSFTENDRKFQSSFGNSFPGDARPTFSQAIAWALATEFGDVPSAKKIVARLSHSSERAVRNWFEGKNGPNGDSLISLIACSDVVLSTILILAGRKHLSISVNLAELRHHLAKTIEAIDTLEVTADHQELSKEN